MVSTRHIWNIHLCFGPSVCLLSVVTFFVGLKVIRPAVHILHQNRMITKFTTITTTHFLYSSSRRWLLPQVYRYEGGWIRAKRAGRPPHCNEYRKWQVSRLEHGHRRYKTIIVMWYVAASYWLFGYLAISFASLPRCDSGWQSFAWLILSTCM